jgi:hypothetical protein
MFVAAAGIAASASWLAARLIFPPNLAGVASFCAAWITLYPVARLNRDVPAWAHWAQGGIILIAFWLLTRFSR